MSFEASLRRQINRAKADLHEVARVSMLMVAGRIINRSPVGNPDLWQVNANYWAMGKKVDRLTYNAFVDEHNATRDEGDKRMRKLSQKQVDKGLKLRHSDYVGGRFRNNWQFGIGTINTDTSLPPEASGESAMSRAREAANHMGPVIYMTNALPYARRLEFEGWSTQAPAGMVRVTLAEWPQIVRDAIASLA